MISKNWRRYTAASVVALLVGLTDTASAHVTFEWATVGNPGNAADPLNEGNRPGIGSVAYEYRIAKHEVTNDQYAEFLNAVASTDTNALYSASMNTDARGGITQSGASGSFTYSVKTDMGDKPVNYVTFFDAMRFVNWLHNGQPSGAQDASTTENGVYDIFNGVSETRAGDAQFFIPTKNEWYKAAYHQPSANGGDADDYWLYPTASNNLPTVATADPTGNIGNPGANVANYDLGADWNGQDGNVTTVGSAGLLSEGFYGTSDQGGNVWEWNETSYLICTRSLSGGSWFGSEGALQSFTQAPTPPTSWSSFTGFRVASPVFCGSADLDCDGDVDLEDHAAMQNAFTGPQ